MKNKIMIKLTQEAYLCTGTYRKGIYALAEWYEAVAVDEDKNQYTVIWEVDEDYDPETMEEDMACDWSTPWDVVDDNGEHVTDEVVIVR